MKMISRRRAAARMIAAIGIVSLVTACAGNGGAGGGGDTGENYPDRNITFVVTFSAGGPTDNDTRKISKPMANERSRKNVIKKFEGSRDTEGAGKVPQSELDRYT